MVLNGRAITCSALTCVQEGVNVEEVDLPKTGYNLSLHVILCLNWVGFNAYC